VLQPIARLGPELKDGFWKLRRGGRSRCRLPVPQVVQLPAGAFGGTAEARFPSNCMNSRCIVSGTNRTQIVEEFSCFGFADRSVANDPHDQDSCPVAQLDFDAVLDSQGSMCLRDSAVHSHPTEVAGTSGLRAGLENPCYLKPFIETNGHILRV
jgi:hypothetical protein